MCQKEVDGIANSKDPDHTAVRLHCVPRPVCLNIFSLAVFEENDKVLSYPSRRLWWCLCRAKTFTFSDISVLLEALTSWGAHTSRGGNPPIFLMPFFLLRIF